jgi:hypothetical protein
MSFANTKYLHNIILVICVIAARTSSSENPEGHIRPMHDDG